MAALAEKRVLITGSSRGIGAAVAHRFAAEGARITLNYSRDEAGAAEVLNALAGEGHIAVRADVSDPRQAEHLVDAAVEEMGGLDILVNNAAVYEFQPFTMPSYEEWQNSWSRTLGINLMGPVNLIHRALPHFSKAGGGKVITIGSRGGFRGEPEAPAYAVAKLGLVALTRSLAKAHAADGIYAYCIAPGWTDTEMARPRFGPKWDAVLAETPYGRIADPKDVAGVALFLASSDADYLSGITIDVNGASYLH